MLLPSVVFTEMVHLPFCIPVTFPEEATVAIFLLLETYFKLLFVALEGETVAEIFADFPFFIESDAFLSVIFLTRIFFCLTVIFFEAL